MSVTGLFCILILMNTLQIQERIALKQLLAPGEGVRCVLDTEDALGGRCEDFKV